MTIKTTYIQRFGDAMELLCRKRPSDDLLKGWLHPEKGDERLQEFAIEHGPEWAQGIVIIDSAHVMADTPEEGEAHLPLDMREILGQANAPESAVRIKVKQASDQLLDYAVAVTRGLIYEGWDHERNAILVRHPDSAELDVFRPTMLHSDGLFDSRLCSDLMFKYRIGVTPHLVGWIAKSWTDGSTDGVGTISSTKNVALGDTIEEAVLRVYVQMNYGPVFCPPESLVRHVEIARAFPPEVPDFDQPRPSA